MLHGRTSSGHPWAITTDSTLIEEPSSGYLSSFPESWLPPELQLKYAEVMQKIPENQVISISPKMLEVSSTFSFLNTRFETFIYRVLLVESTSHIYDEEEARKFAEPIQDRYQRTGWGSRRGYYLTEINLTEFASNLLKVGVLPYVLKRFLSGLKLLLYRSVNINGVITGHRPAQWVRDVVPYLQEWARVPELKQIYDLLMIACYKEPNLIRVSNIQRPVKTANTRLPLPPLDELHRRDRVMRAWFSDRNWSDNAEFQLKRSFALSSRTLLPDYPLLIDDEWEATSNRTDLGRGDLLFVSSDGKCAAVVELKANSNSTAESVRDQARNYANLFYEKYDVEGVCAYIVRTTSKFVTSCPEPELVLTLGEIYQSPLKGFFVRRVPLQI